MDLDGFGKFGNFSNQASNYCKYFSGLLELLGKASLFLSKVFELFEDV